MNKLKYIFLAIVFVVMFIVPSQEDAQAKAMIVIANAPASLREPRTSAKEAPIPVNGTATLVNTTYFSQLHAELAPIYLAVPEENLNPIPYVAPLYIWEWQMGQIMRWSPIVDDTLETGDYPNVGPMLILSMIGQESQGNQEEYKNLMGIVARSWLGTEKQLENPTYNISVGISMINTIYDQALEHGFRPGREATRAALAAYNCGWDSLLIDRCLDVGGFAYADKVLNYWNLHLTNYTQGA
jgi:soluble lytic murein transglycosylase-like protein